MWHHRFEMHTTLTPDQIWPVLANVSGWADVDHNIEKIAIGSPPGLGVAFTLKPKGGPTLAFIIADFDPPHRYSDVCKMPFAVMKTLHTLDAEATGSRVRVDIEITGPLSALWGFLVGRKHASGLPDQTKRILNRAGNDGNGNAKR